MLDKVEAKLTIFEAKNLILHFTFLSIPISKKKKKT